VAAGPIYPYWLNPKPTVVGNAIYIFLPPSISRFTPELLRAAPPAVLIRKPDPALNTNKL